jgi:cytochrome P450
MEEDLLGPMPEFLQAVAGDVVQVTVPTGVKVWMVHDYALGRQVLSNPVFSRSEAVKPHSPKSTDVEPVEHSIMSMDGVEHTRLRRIVAKTFTARRVADLAPLIERLADEYLDRMAASGPPADFMAAIANPLPLVVICGLLGVPPKDSDKFKDCVEVLFDLTASTLAMKSHRRMELVAYMAELIERKRREPSNDLVSALIQLHGQRELSKQEMLTMCLTLLMAGYETTVGQVGLMALSVLGDGQTYQRLLKQPELVPAAVEETIRLNPATPVTFARVALARTQVGSVTVDAGEAVHVVLLQANRDQKVFAKSDRLVLDEHLPTHLTFGYGAHRCLGPTLGRLQLQIVLSRLVERFPALRLADCPERVVWKAGLATRGLKRLTVDWS